MRQMTILFRQPFQPCKMEQTVGQYFKSIQVLFMALVMGQVMVAGALFAFVTPPAKTDDLTPKFMVVLSIGLLFVVWFVWKKRMEHAQNTPYLSQKLSQYLTASLIKWALFEWMTFTCLIVYFFISPEPYLLAPATISILAMGALYPNKNRIIQDLGLSSTEAMRLDQPDLTMVDLDKK
jgi:hypothetical protein